MKFVHLSDLHLGISVNGVSLLEDQQYILQEILKIIEEENPDAVLIAGDIYDTPVPPAAAMKVFDAFLGELAAAHRQVFIISGNHDSAERIAYCSGLMNASGIHFSPVYDGRVEPFVLADKWGTVNVYMLPYIRKGQVRSLFPEEEIADDAEAVRTAIAHMHVDPAQRNVLVAHLFVTGASTSDSEEYIGGLGSISSAAFKAFDYTALGHIHRPQAFEEGRVQYCGSPLKYSFSEVRDIKKVIVAELGAKGELNVRSLPLKPRRDMKEIKVSFAQAVDPAFYEGTDFPKSYLRIILTDQQYVPQAMSQLQKIYPYAMRLDYERIEAEQKEDLPPKQNIKDMDPMELFSSFYYLQHQHEMTERQKQQVQECIDEIWGGEQV